MTNTEKQYFTVAEIAADLISTLENGFSQDYSALFVETFDTDYYIIGTYEAEKALAQYGTFVAIEEVREYEYNNFGNFNIEIQAEKIANMLFYIKAETAIYNDFEFNCILDEAVEDLELEDDDLWNTAATPEVNSYIIRKLLPFTEEEEA